MAPKQAQFLIPNDRILCSLVQADKDNGIINREFLFSGTGAQFNGGSEPDPTLPGLVLPLAATTAGAEGAAGVPVFPTAQYLAMFKVKDYEGAAALQGTFHRQLDNAKATTGQQALADIIISALFDFLAKEDLHGWAVNKNSVICRVPARETPETPVVIVVQPQPVWGTR